MAEAYISSAWSRGSLVYSFYDFTRHQNVSFVRHIRIS